MTLLNDYSYVRDVLPGRLEVAIESVPHVHSVSVGVWVRVGSRHEPSDLAGVSHVVEHLLFKGTAARTARQIAEEVDSIGGLLNGYTSKEYSCYYVKVLSTHLEKAMELLSDLILSPRLDEDDLAKEKGVILEEIDMYEDTPDELVGDLLSEAVWQDHPLGRPVLGLADTVSTMSREAVAGHHGATYRQPRTVVALAGNVAVSTGMESCRQYFGNMATGGSEPDHGSPVFAAGCRSKTKPIEQAHICLGFPGLPLGDPAIFDFNLLAGVLGGGTSSRLFQSIREDRGLAYSVYAYTSTFSDAGLLGLYAAVSPDRACEVLRLVASEIFHLCHDGPTAEEVRRAKDQAKAALLLGLENTSNRMSRLGRSLLLLGRILSLEEVTRRLDAVTAESLVSLGQRVLLPSRVALAAVGPGTLPDEAGLRAALDRGWSE